MNRIIAFLSLLSLTAVITLSPVLMLADGLREPNSPSFSQNNSSAALNKPSAMTDIKDIMGPVVLPEPLPYLRYGIITLVFLSVIALLFFLLKGKKKHPPLNPNASDIALSALTRAEERLSETGPVAFAVDVSTILRSYIEQRFFIPSTKQTTSEFFQRLKNNVQTEMIPLSSHADSLGECLSLCDLAKYAHYSPEHDAAHHLSATARNFINDTKSAEAKD